MATPVFDRAAILGVGLIGGSIAAGLRQAGIAKRIVGYSPFDGDEALALGLVDELVDSPLAAVQHADLIVLAVPPGAVAKVLLEALPNINPLAVITDVSSVKGQVIPAILGILNERVTQFVSSHPIAGSERGGPSAARANLFQGARVVINPLSMKSPTLAQDTVSAMWTSLGARVVLMPLERHDDLYAAVSHLPHLVAFALCSALAQRGDADELVHHGGAGLRDTSRVGASGAELWTDILLGNREALLTTAAQFESAWGQMRDALQANDRQTLQALIAPGSHWRRGLEQT